MSGTAEEQALACQIPLVKQLIKPPFHNPSTVIALRTACTRKAQ